jgi:hypothetical protein
VHTATARDCLTTIANRCGTDKGSVAGAGHAYTLVYDMLFRPLRDRPINLLEIGLAAGGPEVDGGSADRSVAGVPSIRMWREYFPQARIYGLDISDFRKFETNWFKFFRADCGNAAELKRVADSGVEFDIIVDDGSHASYHQQLALLMLFPTLKSGGIYAIEDLDWQPTHYERSLPQVPRTVDFLRSSPEYAAMLFGENQMMATRRSFNSAARQAAAMPHYIDRFTPRGYVRRLIEAAGLCFSVVGGNRLYESRIKLAIIQKN